MCLPRTETTMSAEIDAPAMIGVEKCGCVTWGVAVLDASEPLSGSAKEWALETLQRGGSVERTTVAEAKAREHFLPDECPHEPKGWSRG
jgi:hypothetical protein